MNSSSNGQSPRCPIIENPSDEDMEIVRNGLMDHDKEYPYGELDIPDKDICLALKNADGDVLGGVITSMKTGIMHLEVLWVDDRFRGQGYGRDIVLEAERIGRQKDYPTSSTWTFSFQAHGFYQAIGYKVLGIFDGYFGDITEFVLMKKLDNDRQTLDVDDNRYENEDPNRLSICEDYTEDSIRTIRQGLGKDFSEHVGKIQEKYPDSEIKLVVKDKDSRVIGGIHAGTILGTMYIKILWMDEGYRSQGYGRHLLMEAERIAKERGCISGQACVLSFQALGFFKRLGYVVFGVSDGYPGSIKEYYHIKRF